MATYEEDTTARRPTIGAGSTQADPARDADLIRPRMDAEENDDDVDEDLDLDTDDDLDMDEEGDEDDDMDLDDDEDDLDDDEDDDLDNDDLEADDDDAGAQNRTSDGGDGGINDGVAGPSQSMGASPNDASPGKLGGTMGGGFGSGA